MATDRLGIVMNDLREAIGGLPMLIKNAILLVDHSAEREVTQEDKVVMASVGSLLTLTLGSLYAIAEQLDRLNNNLENGDVQITMEQL